MTNRKASADAIRQLNEELSSIHAVLTSEELVWKAKGPLLESRGYRLRPRYRDGWIPSWLDRDVEFESCEDWHLTPVCSHKWTAYGC